MCVIKHQVIGTCACVSSYFRVEKGTTKTDWGRLVRRVWAADLLWDKLVYLIGTIIVVLVYFPLAPRFSLLFSLLLWTQQKLVEHRSWRALSSSVERLPFITIASPWTRSPSVCESEADNASTPFPVSPLSYGVQERAFEGEQVQEQEQEQEQVQP